MSRPLKPPVPHKQLHLRIEGTLLTNWQQLVRNEGGSEAEHARNALKAYIAHHGYPKPPAK